MYVNYHLSCVLLIQQTNVFAGYVPSMNMLLVHVTSPKTRVLNSFPWRQGKKILNLSGSEYCTTWEILDMTFPPNQHTFQLREKKHMQFSSLILQIAR